LAARIEWLRFFRLASAERGERIKTSEEFVSMRRSSTRSTACLRFSVFLIFGGFSSVSCGDIGDPNYAPPSVTPLNQVDLDNAPFCVGTCAPDYGSQRINCDAEDGYEFFPLAVLDAGVPMGEAVPPNVSQFYAYNDGSAEFMVAGPNAFPRNAIVTNDQGSTNVSNYEPQSVLVNDRCGPDETLTPQYVHHLRGGLFTEWGGGMGRRLLNFASTASTLCMNSAGAAPGAPTICPDADERIESVADRAGNGNLRTNFYGMMADLSEWEGISFWARQGPDNTAGIRVYVGDRQLDEDIAFLETNAGLTPMCGRSRECSCRNHRPCTQSDLPRGGYYCWDPAIDPSPATLAAAVGNSFINPYDICGTTLCDADNAAWPNVTDTLFATPDHQRNPGGAQCQLYKLTNDLESYYCYDASDPITYPPDGPEQCGDGWAKGVALSTDWQFYAIPFSDLRQEGWGKEFAYLDTSKITLVRFTWMQGWVDVWLDDVRFYRHAGSAQQTP
jgi:hypothetical protein